MQFPPKKTQYSLIRRGLQIRRESEFLSWQLLAHCYLSRS